MWKKRAVLFLVLGAAIAAWGGGAARADVLRVGTWNRIPGHFKTIQAAVDAAHPGDWILVAPGDYKELGMAGAEEPAGVLITRPNVHLRGMDRNTVVVDGTRPGTPARCSSRPLDQAATRPQRRRGLEERQDVDPEPHRVQLPRRRRRRQRDLVERRRRHREDRDARVLRANLTASSTVRRGAIGGAVIAATTASSSATRTGPASSTTHTPTTWATRRITSAPARAATRSWRTPTAQNSALGYSGRTRAAI